MNPPSSAGDARSPRRLGLSRLLLALGSLVASLVALELGVRAFAPQPTLAEAPRLLRGQLTEPGDHALRTAEYEVVAHVNRHGFVDHEWSEVKDHPRVLVLGDSFVQAAQVPLEAGFGRRLAAELGGTVDVESMGVPGAGQATELDVLTTYGLARDPDVVVLGFLVANDVLNNHPLLEAKDDKPFYRLRGGDLERVDAVGWSPPGGPLWSLSAAWRLVARTFAERALVTQKLALGGGIPIDLRVYDPAPSPVWDEAWAVTDALVGALARRCAEAGVGFGVVLFPDAVQATRDGRARADQRWPPLAGWDPAAAQARAHTLLSARAPVQDLLPDFVAADAAGAPPLYLAEDGHWTAAGHALAARGAAPFVARLLREAGATGTGG